MQNVVVARNIYIKPCNFSQIFLSHLPRFAIFFNIPWHYFCFSTVHCTLNILLKKFYSSGVLWHKYNNARILFQQNSQPF